MEINRFEIDANWPQYPVRVPDPIRRWAKNYQEDLPGKSRTKPTLEQIYLRLIASGSVILTDSDPYACCDAPPERGIAFCRIHYPPDLHDTLTDLCFISGKSLIAVILSCLQKGYEVATRQTIAA